MINMKKYSTGDFGNNPIEEIEILRETDKSIFWSNPNRFNGKEQRSLKRSSWMNYWNTWEEAYNHLLEKAEKSVKDEKYNLLLAEQKLQNILKLKEKYYGESL